MANLRLELCKTAINDGRQLARTVIGAFERKVEKGVGTEITHRISGERYFLPEELDVTLNKTQEMLRRLQGPKEPLFSLHQGCANRYGGDGKFLGSIPREEFDRLMNSTLKLRRYPDGINQSGLATEILDSSTGNVYTNSGACSRIIEANGQYHSVEPTLITKLLNMFNRG